MWGRGDLACVRWEPCGEGSGLEEILVGTRRMAIGGISDGRLPYVKVVGMAMEVTARLREASSDM